MTETLRSGLEIAAHPPKRPRPVGGSEPRRVNNLTLVDGKTFLATTLAGDIVPAGAGDVGLFQHDTRFLSCWELRLNRLRAVVLSAASQLNLQSQIELTTASPMTRDNLDLPENTVHIHREQLLAGSFFDRLNLHNFNFQPVTLVVEINFEADFADVFEVRGMARLHAGIYFEPDVTKQQVVFCYLGRDGWTRRTTICFHPAPRRLSAQGAEFEIHLAAGGQAEIEMEVEMRASGPPDPARADRAGTAGTPSPGEHKRDAWQSHAGARANDRYGACLAKRRQSYEHWEHETTEFASSDDRFNRCLHTAVSDFFALRIPFDPPASDAECGYAAAPAGETIAAGIPWFATVFGRDSLIAGYQSLLLSPNLARDTLRYLARHQGQCHDDWRDEDPGKILHESREGEMTRAGEMPHSPYFGSVDSTPLFLILLDETYAWTGDDALIEELMPAARRALGWLEQYGDLDGDGFVEYLRRSPQGLTNQGWKDSWDAYVHRDGSPAAPPLALCEVQGYCYDARYRMAKLLRLGGETAPAERLRRDATELAQRFDRAFWLPDQSYCSMALDAAKHPLTAVGSNPGHLLWSRILGREHARQLARRLMRADMFSGWGIRTLSAEEPGFNPLSYHRGSVWPHDNALIAHGMALYDFKQPLLRVFTGLYQAAAYFRDQRLPELFVGVPRAPASHPVNYPVSCSPQAWASGAWFMLLTAALGLRPNAGRRELRVVNPTLPEWLDWFRIHRLRIGRSQVSLEFTRRGERTFCNLLDVRGDRLAVSVDFNPRSGPEI